MYLTLDETLTNTNGMSEKELGSNVNKGLYLSP